MYHIVEDLTGKKGTFLLESYGLWDDCFMIKHKVPHYLPNFQALMVQDNNVVTVMCFFPRILLNLRNYTEYVFWNVSLISLSLLKIIQSINCSDMALA